MSKMFFVTACLVVGFAVSAFTMVQMADQKYIGSAGCKGCHNTDARGKQYERWEKSAHANALKVLQTPEADKIAKEKGFATKAAETDNCLSCHVTGKMTAGAQFDATFKADEGVGCESCHGAASGYKMLHMKKENLEKAMAAGMVIPKVADGSAEKQCVQCHNEKSPTYKSFTFAEKWALIAHPMPAK